MIFVQQIMFFSVPKTILFSLYKSIEKHQTIFFLYKSETNCFLQKSKTNVFQKMFCPLPITIKWQFPNMPDTVYWVLVIGVNFNFIHCHFLTVKMLQQQIFILDRNLSEKS